MSYKTELQNNNIDLQAILNSVNNLPEASGSGGGAKFEVARVTIHVDTSGYKNHGGFGEGVSSCVYGVFVDEDGYVTSLDMNIDTDNDVTVCVANGSILMIEATDYSGYTSIEDVEADAITIITLPDYFVCTIPGDGTIRVPVVS